MSYEMLFFCNLYIDYISNSFRKNFFLHHTCIPINALNADIATTIQLSPFKIKITLI